MTARTINIQDMVGNKYKHNLQEHLIQNITEKNGEFYVVTNVDFYKFDTKSEHRDFLAQMEPIKDNPIPSGSIVPTDEHGLIRPNSGSGDIMAYLKGLLIEDIERVREDPTYVKQATATSNNVKRLVDVVKLEILIKKNNGK